MAIYLACAIIAFVCLIIFVVLSDKKVLFYNASFFIFTFIANMGYVFIALANNVEEAIVANKMIYFSGCGMSLFLIMLVLDTCKINLHKITRLSMYGFSFTVLVLAMTVGYSEIFYSKTRLDNIGGISVLIREYGPAHNLFIIMISSYMLLGVFTLIHAIVKKKIIVYRNVVLLMLCYIITAVCYVTKRLFPAYLDPVCIAYCISDILLLGVSYTSCLYNLDEAMLSSVEKQEDYGYVLLDMKGRYVGSNALARRFIPELNNHKLLKKLDADINPIVAKMLEMICQYDKDNKKVNISYNGLDLELGIQNIYKNDRKKGYIISIVDDSKQQMYIRELDMVSKNKSHFLSNVSHELRTPMNAILGMNEMILRECNDSAILEYSSNIENSGKMLLQIINDVLDLNKIESGKMDIIETNYQLADIILDMENMIKPLVKTDRQELIIKCGDNLPKTLHGDSVRLKQMITNILTNAVKYTEKGQILFEVSGEKKENIFYFSFLVRDTGKGIRQEDIPLLFDAFERAEQLRNNAIEGTGLGLAITQKFAHLMGGEILVDSVYGKGSVFTILIPQTIVGEELMGDYHRVQEEKKHEYHECFVAPNVKLLVVDDVKTNLLVIKHLLKNNKMQMTFKMSGKDCIDILKEETFDIILLDHMMPDLDGVETLNTIRQEHLCDQTPIIALTAIAESDSAEKYKKLGFTDYMSKPVDGHELEKMILKYIPKESII